jgi:hypothetical protein
MNGMINTIVIIVTKSCGASTLCPHEVISGPRLTQAKVQYNCFRGGPPKGTHRHFTKIIIKEVDDC